MRLTAIGSVIVVAAIGAAVAGAPPAAVGLYGDRVYPALQAVVTPLSNRVPIPLFDALLALLIVLAVWAVARVGRRAWRTRSIRPIVRTGAVAAVVAAGLYLWFLVLWGYNYRRPGVEAALPAFHADRSTPAMVRRLAELAVSRSNRLHAEAHRTGFPAIDEVPRPLLESLHEVEGRLGRARPTAVSRPKRPWTTPYMRAVGVSGMLAPWFLETYLNPDLTGPERPYVLAHEWAHLSGFAPEEDASFVGLLTAMGAADPASQYSAWLFLASEAAMRLPPGTREQVLAGLDDGPRDDLRAIAARLQSRVPWLDQASWVAYDHAIKSQGAEEGVGGYGRVIDLVLGSGVLTEMDAEPREPASARGDSAELRRGRPREPREP